MKIIHTLTLVLLLHFAWAQSPGRVIKGTTIDNATGTPLPYTSIGIPHKSIGTVSDSSGQFTLTLPPDHPLTDSIVFSHVGYESQAKRIDGLLRQVSAIRLQPSTNSLSEVVVKPKITKSKIVGRNGKGLSTFHYNFYTASEKSVDDRLSKEAGMLFELKDECRIDELNFYISGNEFRSLKFRVLFYHVKDGLPTTPMFDRDIIFEIKDGYRGWFKVDLKT
ncbi:MAG TPA: carboxypeptidase-like regulatory domain-containing protein, partial [Phnomibacter sp.]|nr:carboxypeptidase-like regulatory domain-containing protein [Phnomibacter sp.]